ncbi:YciI family protein [Streptomyces sp. NRRL S-241]|uniref:YciI family protein n=1 Tax=Streptomyces sp. NRRL S-241 TaxID=1463896 RepID=UPI001F40C58A|nr:YciI family protein [Streptomyces sp. NRRL S-241]
MKYMIQMNVPAAEWDAVMSGYSEQDMQAMFAHMNALNDELTSAGEWVDGQGLGGPALVKTVRAGSDGRPEVTDGPARAGDILAGYWVVDVKSEDRALEIARVLDVLGCPDNAAGCGAGRRGPGKIRKRRPRCPGRRPGRRGGRPRR